MKPFFQIVEKDGTRKQVHSQSDLDYMMNRGWKVAEFPKPKIEKPVELETFVEPLKRKPGRPRK